MKRQCCFPDAALSRNECDRQHGGPRNGEVSECR
jgi:hypothetical protein